MAEGYRELTVGNIRELIKDLPDSAVVSPDWHNFDPGDLDPVVILNGIAVRTVVGSDAPGVRVISKYGMGAQTEHDDGSASMLWATTDMPLHVMEVGIFPSADCLTRFRR